MPEPLPADPKFIAEKLQADMGYLNELARACIRTRRTLLPEPPDLATCTDNEVAYHVVCERIAPTFLHIKLGTFVDTLIDGMWQIEFPARTLGRPSRSES